jgi:hypothetical protein
MAYMTEATAATVECPHFRDLINQDAVMQNGAPPVYVHRMCMGSRCQTSWRWADMPRQDPDAPFEPYGYCGIAGKP